MTIKDVLAQTKHRPWKLPQYPWTFYQEWNRALFLHWEVDIDVLQPFVPKELEIDTLNGKAYVSMVAFTMEKIRPKHLPSFSPVSNFDEINIRTYVKMDGKPGVYFLSIEGGKKVSCTIAKQVSELPYRYSKMQRDSNSYRSENKKYTDKLYAQFEIKDTVDNKSELDLWLTERYALFQDSGAFINAFEIHHIEWPIQHVDINQLEINYPRFKQLINNTPLKAQYSKGVQVIAWDKTIRPKVSFR